MKPDYSLAHTLRDWRALRKMWLEDDGLDIGDKSVCERCYHEGEQAFAACLDHNREDNPYMGLDGPAYEQRGPWFWGYRAAAQAHFNARYRLEEMQARIRAIVAEHGLTVEYSDEYSDPYAKTPEGFTCKLV